MHNIVYGYAFYITVPRKHHLKPLWILNYSSIALHFSKSFVQKIKEGLSLKSALHC